MKDWSILVATVFDRSDKLVRLLSVLVPQVIAHGDQVELLISSDDRVKSVGKKRQELVEKAKGEFISFVDDDDMVADDYVAKILPHLHHNDYIGFKVQLYHEGEPDLRITIHDARLSGVYSNESGYYRDLSHLNPIRKSIAMLGKFDGGNKEDDRWADMVRPHKKLIRHSRFIDEVMYHYYFDPKTSLFRKDYKK